jgi:heat shock protein HslJ
MTVPRAGSRRARLAPFLVVALMVGACTSAAPTPAATAAASPSAATGSAAPLALDGTTWLLTDYVSPDAAHFTVPAAVTPTAKFDAGTISGNAGCNTFSAPYTIQGDSITFGPAVSTKIACESPMSDVENAYLQALSVSDKVAILDDGRLQLWDSEGKTTLAFIKGS